MSEDYRVPRWRCVECGTRGPKRRNGPEVPDPVGGTRVVPLECVECGNRGEVVFPPGSGSTVVGGFREA